MTSPTVEASARRFLRWFPVWMRADRGEEAVSLVLDQVPEGASTLPWRSKADLIRAGLHARRRGTPPMRVWSIVSSPRATNWAGREPAVPLVWRPWLVSKLERRSFAWQCALYANSWTCWYVLYVLMTSGLDPSFRHVAISLVVALGITAGGCAWFLLARRPAWRARLLAANGLGEDGRPLPPDAVTVTWLKPTFENVWIRPLAIGAVVGSVACPIVWMTFGEGSPKGQGSLAGTVVAFTVLVGGVAAWTRSRVRATGLEPAGGRGPEQRRADGGLAFVYGAGVGAAIGFCTALVGLMCSLHAALVLAPPVAAVVGGVILVARERTLGRPLGSWDVLPSSGPQQVVRRFEDLPPPPGPPETPAFG